MKTSIAPGAECLVVQRRNEISVCAIGHRFRGLFLLKGDVKRWWKYGTVLSAMIRDRKLRF